MIVTQERTARNCTVRSSDLGLGGGVFVAGTTFCEEQNPSVMMFGSFPTTHTQYTPNYDQGYQEQTPKKNESSHTYKKTQPRTQSGTTKKSTTPSKFSITKKTESPKNSGTKSGSHSW